MSIRRTPGLVSMVKALAAAGTWMREMAATVMVIMKKIKRTRLMSISGIMSTSSSRSASGLFQSKSISTGARASAASWGRFLSGSGKYGWKATTGPSGDHSDVPGGLTLSSGRARPCWIQSVTTWNGTSLVTVLAWTNQRSKNRFGWSDMGMWSGKGLPPGRFRSATRPALGVPLLRLEGLEQQEQPLGGALHLDLELGHPGLEQDVG